MTANQAEVPIGAMARTLGVSRRGFHARQRRAPSRRVGADAALTGRIKAIHKASKQTCGAPRVRAGLADEAVHVGRKRVERLMTSRSDARAA